MPTPTIAVFPHPSGVYYAHLVDPDAGINIVAPTPFDTNGLAVEHVAARLRKVRGNEDAVIRPHRTAEKWINYARHEGHLDAITEAFPHPAPREGTDHDAAS
ncbi:hypothetical protein MXD62_27605 [Frankia sp. Mgl5]|uniref:hypothetical protein n=1 Tax=Frankia sp. Mgl5 TaxID=2933793 RepID=UPI00200CB5C7|nr:hypothetical protein [Frankia sp. Mgl5]MCK9930861.1 hypothetical protein [Frankia sp. Mgl5]